MILSARHQNRGYELMIIHHQLPDHEPHCVIAAIRTAGVSPSELPVIMLGPDRFEFHNNSGVQGWLSLDFNLSELLSTLNRWLPTQIVENPGAQPCNISALN